MPEYGPYETGDQARMIPEVRVIFEAFDHGSGTGDLSGAPLILAACKAAGIELGAYDARTVAGFGNLEPATCAVIAGLIMRAWDDGSPLAYCRHCGMDIEPCPHPRSATPVCRGWRHSGRTSQPVGAHYCGGRSISPSAEPAIREEAPDAE